MISESLDKSGSVAGGDVSQAQEVPSDEGRMDRVAVEIFPPNNRGSVDWDLRSVLLSSLYYTKPERQNSLKKLPVSISVLASAVLAPPFSQTPTSAFSLPSPQTYYDLSLGRRRSLAS